METIYHPLREEDRERRRLGAGIPASGRPDRFAPEHPVPGAVEDATAAYRGRAAQGFTDIALAGDSAGGCIAGMRSTLYVSA